MRVAEFEGIDETLGYAVMNAPRLHWVYVKQPYRQQHLASALIRGAGLTEYTEGSTLVPARKFLTASGMQFNPYPLMEK